jgi:hypothetical protein
MYKKYKLKLASLLYMLQIGIKNIKILLKEEYKKNFFIRYILEKNTSI